MPEEIRLKEIVTESDELKEALLEHEVSVFYSEDRLKAYLKLAKPVEPEKLKKLVEDAGIVHGLNEEILSNRPLIWRHIVQKKLVPIAEIDIPPFPLYDIEFGQHAEEILAYLNNRYTNAEGVTADKQLPLLNFREGSIFGKRLDPNDLHKQSFPKDVFGEKRDDLKRRVVFFPLGKGLAQNPEQEIIVMVSGFLEISGDRLTIKDRFVIEDVDDWAGKTLRFIGSVEVAENVIQHFDIDADQDIVIGGSTESSNLKSGGKILVKEGIVGQGEALVQAKELIRAKYINQAKVLCAQDCEIASGIFHSNVICHGRLNMEKGPIVGGSVYASYGVDARFIGAVGGTRTVVAAGFNADIPLSLDKAVEEFKFKQEKLVELSMRLKDIIANPGAVASFNSAEKKAFADLHDKMKSMKRRLDELKEWLDSHDFDAASKAKIMVRGKVFPGTLIKLHYQAYEVREEMSRVMFAIDPESHELIPIPMKLR